MEAELPFIAMLVYVLSHESFPSLRYAFEKIEGLGRDVFPAFHEESLALARNLTYQTGSEQSTTEATFDSNPSDLCREFIHGYLRTLSSGSDVHGFVKAESERLTGILEERWRSYSGMVSSVTEVAFMFLAIFPIGMQMIAGALLNESSAELLMSSLLLLVVVTGAILLWLDYAQPSLHDSRFPLSWVVVAAGTLCALIALYLLGVLGPTETALLALVASSAFVFFSRRFFKELRAGEREVVRMLHDLAEEARSGVSLPDALARLEDRASRYTSLGDAISTFTKALSLGQTPRLAQHRVRHPSWLVRVSFGLLAVSFETGSGYEQLDKLSLSFSRISDARRTIQSSVLPFAVLGSSVPAISVASYWFLSNMQGFSFLVPGLSLASGTLSVGVSVIASSILTGFIVSKAYSFSFRSLVGIPPILVTALLAFLFFGLG